MTDFDKNEHNELSEIDELLGLMEDTDDEDTDYDDELEELDELDDEADGEQESGSNALKELAGKAEDVYYAVAENAYYTYTEPDEKTIVSGRTSVIITAVCTACFILLTVLGYFFFTSFNYYTTGVTVDEFIDRFNGFELTSDSDIYYIIPSYTDVVIPEDAKLGGRNTIELMDGHVVIEANTRFGKIVDLTVRNVDYPGYNSEIHYFDVTDDSTDYLYYYVCLGKALAAFQPEIETIYDATYSAYQLHNYAFIYSLYGQGDVYTVEVEPNTISYHLVDACLTIEPTQRTITSAVWPEWLQPKEKVEEPAVDDTLTSGSDTAVSAADAQ